VELVSFLIPFQAGARSQCRLRNEWDEPIEAIAALAPWLALGDEADRLVLKLPRPNFTLNPAKPLIWLASVQNRSHNIILKRALIID
jgi:hypothetical protein